MGSSLNEAISSNSFKLFLLDSLNYAIKSFGLKKQKTDYEDGFLRYEKYTRKDIHRILNWPKEPNHQSVGGYMSSPDKQNCPIFVKYKKDEKIADTMKYEDKFINNFTLEWYSKNSRTLKSGDVIEIIKSSQNNMRLPLFLKKDDNEGLDFYFLGDLKVDKNFLEETFIIDKKNNLVLRQYSLESQMSDKAVLFFHGGGYAISNIDVYNPVASLMCEGLDTNIFSLEYSLSPENKFPKALEEANIAFDWLINHGYSKEQIIICGDSAGAHLAASLLHDLKARDEDLPFLLSLIHI